MEMSTMDAVTQRLDRLERENRRLKWVAAAVVPIVLAAGGLALQGRDGPRGEVVAERVVIRDKQGRIRATFGVDRSGLPGLKLLDHRGLEQVALEVSSDDQSSLAFYDRGEGRVLLNTSFEGATSLRLFDKSEKSDATLFITPEGAAGVRVTNGGRAEALGPRPIDNPARTTTEARAPSAGRLDAAPAAQPAASDAVTITLRPTGDEDGSARRVMN